MREYSASLCKQNRAAPEPALENQGDRLAKLLWCFFNRCEHQANSKCDAQNFRFHSRGIASRHRHYWDSGSVAVAGVDQGQADGVAHELPFQSAAIGPGWEGLRRR